MFQRTLNGVYGYRSVPTVNTIVPWHDSILPDLRPLLEKFTLTV